MTPPPMILASSSPYRQELLKKLRLTFTCHSPNIDETPLAGESIEQTVLRLSNAKAKAVALRHPDHIIIASDQSASLNGKALGKPGQKDKAFEQLQQQSGQTITFYTGLVVYNPTNQQYLQACDQTHVKFRQLDNATIERYIAIEQPFDCAGSFKSEGLGICLFESIQTQDPNALIGLPLIQLTSLLKQIGINLP